MMYFQFWLITLELALIICFVFWHIVECWLMLESRILIELHNVFFVILCCKLLYVLRRTAELAFTPSVNNFRTFYIYVFLWSYAEEC